MRHHRELLVVDEVQHDVPRAEVSRGCRQGLDDRVGGSCLLDDQQPPDGPAGKIDHSHHPVRSEQLNPKRQPTPSP